MWGWLSVALSGYISISAQENSKNKQAIVFKTLTYCMLVWMLVSSDAAMGMPVYWVAGGLIISLVAELGYLLRKKLKFCFGTLIIAQLCFSKSFWMQLSGEIIWWLPAMLLGISIVAFFLLLPKLDKLVFPVISMGIILIQLNWAAGEVWLVESSMTASLGFLGTLCLAVAALTFAIEGYRHHFNVQRYISSSILLFAHSLITASLVI